MRAGWWWIDRWRFRKPFPYTDLSCEAQGAFRNVLDEVQIQGRSDLTEPEARRASGASEGEWARVSSDVMRCLREGNWEGVWSPPPFTGELPEQDHRPHIPIALREFVFDRDQRHCQECGSTERLELDHIYPYSLGGEDTEDNLQVLCQLCNRLKGASCQTSS